MTDTIVAVSSPPGGALRAVVRLSGPRAAELGKTDLPSARYLFRAPKSYTRENLVELHIPGSPPLVEALVQSLLDAGARLAEPGEFTQRAYLNGRIDLAGAEAVIDLIDAGNDAEARAALDHKALSEKIRAIETRVLDLCAEVEASIDFTDQDIEIISASRIRDQARSLQEDVDRLLQVTTAARVHRDRPVAMLFGPPNSGKSSLFNKLCGGKVIESDIEGTTRDVIRGEMGEIDLLDTAGWLEEAAGPDAQAVRRTEDMLDRADLVVLVVDASDPDRGTPLEERAARHPLLRVCNKTDLVEGAAERWIRTSAKTGEGLEVLRAQIRERLLSGPGPEANARFHVNLRQMGQIRRARAALVRAQDSPGIEFTAHDLRDAAEAFGSLTGRSVSEELLDRIFSRFCLGK